MNPRLIALLLCSTFILAPAHAGDGGSVLEPSGSVAAASAVVVLGSLSVVGAASAVVIVSVEKVGESTVIVIKDVSQGVSNGARATIRLSGKAAAGVSTAAGQAVTVSATASGYVIGTASEVIAFVPNEIGKALLHSAPHGQ